MTVKELIEQLKNMPQEARVFHLWDGEPRTAINVVYMSKAGHVVTADFEESCYSAMARPTDAPDTHVEHFWKTPCAPKGYAERIDNVWDY